MYFKKILTKMCHFCNKLYLQLGTMLAKAKVNKHNKLLNLKNRVLHVEESHLFKKLGKLSTE